MAKIVTLGEIMLRLSAPGNARLTQTQTLHVAYGGSEANVAISLSLLGMTSEHITAFPDNDFGVAATQHLRKFGVITDHIQYTNNRMGVYFLEEGAMQRSSRIVYDRFDSAFAHINQVLLSGRKFLKGLHGFTGRALRRRSRRELPMFVSRQSKLRTRWALQFRATSTIEEICGSTERKLKTSCRVS